ncbi:hypothetical protein HYQ44_018180 [Verticillium longisporum]|nr:hypothetical protein HYQ44_018180 [Verticillium longisporum]
MESRSRLVNQAHLGCSKPGQIPVDRHLPDPRQLVEERRHKAARPLDVVPHSSPLGGNLIMQQPRHDGREPVAVATARALRRDHGADGRAETAARARDGAEQRVAVGDSKHYHYGKSSTYEQPAALMRNKIEEILAELGDRYATLCLCTARPKQLALGLQKIGLTIPKQFVVVHLVKVLEFQAVPDVINSVLAGQEGFAARANDGEIWTGPGHGADCSLASVLLALVGPLAKNYTGDWKRIEREAVAASRLLGGTGLKVVGEMNKMKSRSSKRGKREPDA